MTGMARKPMTPPLAMMGWGGLAEGDKADKRQEEDRGVAKMGQQQAQPESELQAAAGALGAAVFVVKAGGHGGLVWVSRRSIAGSAFFGLALRQAG